MLVYLLALLLWLPALVGWALPWARLRQRLGGPGWRHVDGGDGVAALATLTALSVLLNFVVPLTAGVSALALLAGWGLLAIRLWLGRLALPRRRVLLAVAGWLTAVALIGNVPPANYDSGLYHLQAIAWIQAGPVPRGLANLQGRYGFDSTAGLLAALLQPPWRVTTPNTLPYLLGGVLLCVYGAELLGSLRRPGLRASRSLSFTVLGVGILASVFNFIAISSPTSDWPIVVLTVLASGVALRAVDDPATTREALVLTTLIAFLALTVKLSALPLFGLPVMLWVYARQRRLRVPWRALVGVGGLASAALVAPWLVRNVLLSGCLAYPVTPVCWPALPWAVSPAGVTAEAGWVISWARIPAAGFAETLRGWGWVPVWAARMSTDSTVALTLLLIVVGALMWAWATRRATIPATDDRWALLIVGLPMLANLAYWFFTAPDIRFVAGACWTLGLLAVSLGYHRLAENAGLGRRAQLVRTASRQVGGLFVILNLVLLGLRSVAYLTSVGPATFVWAWPAAPAVPTETQLSSQGEVIQVPTESDQCWLTPLPCTPYFNPALLIERDALGRVRQFSVEQP